MSRVLTRVPSLYKSISVTTRAPRPGELDGSDYFFVSPDEFEERLGRGEFLEHAVVHGNRYGTLRNLVDEKLTSGDDVILEIDVQGAEQVRRAVPQVVSIFIRPPSLEELRHRLAGRRTESEEALEKRLQDAERELGLASTYDHVVINDEAERAAAQLAAIIERERKPQ